MCTCDRKLIAIEKREDPILSILLEIDNSANPAKILMKQWLLSKKSVISIMIEFADFSGTRVLVHNSFPNKNIRACNVELHDDWNKWFKYDTSLHIQKNLKNIRKIDFAREALELVENYGLKFRTKRDRHVKYLYMKVHGQRDSAESNLKFDNALLWADAYSPGSRELRYGSADAGPHYVLPYITLQVLACVVLCIFRNCSAI